MRKLFPTLALLMASVAAWAQGIPFLQNFSAGDYQAHNRNFDIVADDQGFVYVANFEGLLYYDQAEWRIIHTPNITRITTLFRDAKGIVWAGGYNYLGRIETKTNGELTLTNAVKKGNFHGVIDRIWESEQQLHFKLEEGSNTYTLDNNGKLTTTQTERPVIASDSEAIDIGFGLKAKATENDGVEITNSEQNVTYNITENNGLCSNSVNKLTYNGRGMLWGATNNGIFCIALPTAYTHATVSDGLRGEVLSILKHEGTLYVGTTSGLFYYHDKAFHPVAGMDYQCWQMVSTPKGMLVAASNGLYRVTGKTVAQRLNSQNTMCVKETANGYYTGESDGVYFNGYDGSRSKEADLERVRYIYTDDRQAFWIQNIFGTIWRKKNSEQGFQPVVVDDDPNVPAMIVPTNQGLLTISANQTQPIPYPQFAYMDEEGITWLTGSNGRGLYTMKDGNKQDNMAKPLNAVSDYNVRSMLHTQNRLMMGGGFGLIVYKSDFTDPILENKAQLRIRTVKLGSDSILWGGYGPMPSKLATLSSDERHLEFTFALDNTSLIKKTLYRYRLDRANWSAWDDEQEAKFPTLAFGHHIFEVQALDAYGTESAIVSIEFDISHPFYQRWYMLILYVLIAGILVYSLIRFRLHQLELEKIRLESIVQERTAEVVKQKDEIVKQKDEIEEKSKSLQTALDELAQAQNELIRQEKMATAGKLTQGLIDRILNPLNYINNFTKLSEGLARDIMANIEDEKDNMTPDNYEDTMDVLDMLIGNLQKVGEHGQNNTRILKAMEEMLKDRTSGIKPMDLVPVLNQDKEMLEKYYEEKILQYGIRTIFNIPQEKMSINGNPEQLSMTLMSLLGNAVYAIVKKAQREKYNPEISVNISNDSSYYSVIIRDNGIGIEQTIINKIFDPFFTTKPTGEAAGVGLYISREIIQNHGGDISVKSDKGVYTEFTITLPILQN